MRSPFSQRTAWDTREGELSRAIRERRSAGLPVHDLTVSNPTVCGFAYDPATTLEPLQAPSALVYDPDPRGLRSAREAVAAYYRTHDAHVDPGAVVLTTSTSEAYSFLLRLLTDAGDAVLVAQPGYPLFDFLAQLEEVRLDTFPQFYDYGWWIDFAELERRIGPRTRAILLVSPNNPTGAFVRRAERVQLEALCVRHGLALIVDEVFLDYARPGVQAESFASGPHPCLTFTVSGLSKIAALPQMKVAWLAAFGPAELLAGALARLEIIADTFLSLNAPAQQALPFWLAQASDLRAQIRTRVETNLKTLAQLGFEVLPFEAGWSGILALPRTLLPEDTADELAVTLVRESGVIVHPASFYGMTGRNRLVLSLILGEESMRQGLKMLKSWCESKELT